MVKFVFDTFPFIQYFSERLASEIAHGNSSIRHRSTKRKSYHGNMHIPAGRDMSEELMRQYDTDAPDADYPDDDEIKAMTLKLSAKRKIK